MFSAWIAGRKESLAKMPNDTYEENLSDSDQLIALAKLAQAAELAITEQDAMIELRMLAMAGCNARETRYMRGFSVN